ncbi:outer membrane protein [Oryzibacter oryziterrae]|uniref:outer membrane protein n=1 Tax=Oryzibacter oryziterrae TaxID=2766474 RepID=UPI001F19652F|nr:outer membrane protein [Oryzibacter oryziterrae]
MKKLVLALVAGSALVASAPVFAADLNEPIPEAPAMAPVATSSAFDWTGAYVGAQAGYGWGTVKTGSGDKDVSGFTGGVYGGYNYQVDPHWVVGGEADVMMGPSDKFTSGGTSVKASTDWFGSVRGRVGYAFDNILVYGTAGAVVGQGTAKFNGGSDDNTHVGYVVGAGIEAALTNNITARAEYTYTGTNDKTYTVGADSVKTGLDGSLVTVGLGYKF